MTDNTIDIKHNIEEIKEKLIKSVSKLDEAVSVKLDELKDLREKHNEAQLIDVEKYEQALTEKGAEINSLRGQNELLEKDNAKFKAILSEEKAKNAKLIQFNKDIAARVDDLIEKIETVLSEESEEAAA